MDKPQFEGDGAVPQQHSLLGVAPQEDSGSETTPHTSLPSEGMCLLSGLDSVAQADIFRRYGRDPHSEGWRFTLRRQLRVASIYSRGVLLTDSQLFDGILLLMLGVNGIHQALGESVNQTFMVSFRCSSARKSLERMRENPDFVWQSTDPHTIPSGWSPDEIRELQDEWALAIDRGHIGGFQRTPNADFADQLFRRLTDSEQTLPDLPQPAGTATLQALKCRATRSQAFTLLETLETTDPQTALALRTWWENAYSDVIAAQHSAVWLSSPPAATEATHAHGSVTRSAVRLDPKLASVTAVPARAAQVLTELSRPEYVALQGDTRPFVLAQYPKSTRANRIRVALLIAAQAPRSRPLLKTFAELVSLLLWAIVVFLTIAEGLNQSFAIMLVVASTVGAAIAFPWAEFKHLWDFTRPQNRSLIRSPLTLVATNK